MQNDQILHSLPVGWVECDGKGDRVPDINGKELFLRGGDATSAGKFEEAQLQNHKHNDLGHTHRDFGHSHVDSGHTSNSDVFKFLVPGDHFGDRDGSDGFAKSEWRIMNSRSSNANLVASSSDIQVSKAIIKNVTHARVSVEVRPKNMAVKFIMKIY